MPSSSCRLLGDGWRASGALNRDPWTRAWGACSRRWRRREILLEDFCLRASKGPAWPEAPAPPRTPPKYISQHGWRDGESRRRPKECQSRRQRKRKKARGCWIEIWRSAWPSPSGSWSPRCCAGTLAGPAAHRRSSQPGPSHHAGMMLARAGQDGESLIRPLPSSVPPKARPGRLAAERPRR